MASRSYNGISCRIQAYGLCALQAPYSALEEHWQLQISTSKHSNVVDFYVSTNITTSIFQGTTDHITRVFSCTLFRSLQVSDRPFAVFITSRYKNDCRPEGQYAVSSPFIDTTEPDNVEYLHCDPKCYPVHPQPVLIPQGRNSWLPPLPFQQNMARGQSLRSSRPLLIRNQTAPTSSPIAYSRPNPPSDWTLRRYPSKTSSFSSLSYCSTVPTFVTSTTQQGSRAELRAIPERYRYHPDRYLEARRTPNNVRSTMATQPATWRMPASPPNASKVSQEDLQFWQSGSSINKSEPLRYSHAASSSASVEASLSRNVRPHNRRYSGIEKRKRSYESLRKGKIDMYDEILPTNRGSPSRSQISKTYGPADNGKGDTVKAEPVIRRQSRTLVKKRQPWDAAPRCHRTSRAWKTKPSDVAYV